MSRLPDIEPTVSSDPHGHYDAILSHPAFGCVVVSKPHSSRAERMFGSDLGHHTMVTLEFSEAEEFRGFSDSRHMARKPLLKVAMSESQWARFVASAGNGDGVPVTIEAKGEDMARPVSGIAAPALTKRELHGEEMAAGLRERLGSLRDLAEQLGAAIEGPISKKALRDIQKEIARHVEQMPGSVKFVYDQFARATEKVSEDAKTEVEAHINGVALRLGMDQLRSMSPVIAAPNERTNS